MSLQSAKDFLKRIETDRALKKRLAAALNHAARQRLVQTAGFDFTLGEYKQAVDELSTAASQELTPDELQGVTGGTAQIGWCPFHNVCWSKDYKCPTLQQMA